MDLGEFGHLKGKMDSILENQAKMSAEISTLMETLDIHLNKILGCMSGTRDCLQNNIEYVQSSVKSLDSVIENIQATQSIQCKQTQKLIEVWDSDGDLLSETDMGTIISNPTMDWAVDDSQPFIINHNQAFMKKTKEIRKKLRDSNESAPGSVKRSSVTQLQVKRSATIIWKVRVRILTSSSIHSPHRLLVYRPKCVW